MMLLGQALVGAVLITPVLMGLALVGALLLFRKTGSRWVRGVGALFVLLSLGAAARIVQASLDWQQVWAGLEMEPKVSDQDVVGAWRKGDTSIVFLPDHTFTMRARTGESRGKWELNVDDSFGVRATSMGGLVVGTEQWHALRKRGEVRLIKQPRDWDEWDGDLGFQRQP